MKILAFADFHYSPENSKKCFDILDFIIEKAHELKPDFITHSGDLFNNLITNSERHGLPALKSKLDEISKIAPIIMIYGTPSRHDIPGSLDIFQSDKIKIVRPEIPLIFNGTIFYCIPDARPSEVITEDNPLLAVSDINQYLKNLCLFYSAHRKQNSNLPAVVLGHGIVKNTKNQDNETIKHSAVYTTENDLAQIGADVNLFGHWHIPFMFETIPGGMLGGMAHNWNDLDYYPAIWEFVSEKTVYASIQYQIPFIPRRQKISEYLLDPFGIQNFNGDLLHLEKSKLDPTTIQDLIAAGAHPDSIVTIKPEISHAIRSTEIMTATTREAEFSLYAALQKWEVSTRDKEICAAIERLERAAGVGCEKKRISPRVTHVKGFKPYYNGMLKDEFRIDWKDFKAGLLGIVGPGGKGKSGLVSCIPPHTVNISQAEIFNNLFYLPDSFIIQEWEVNQDIIILKRFFKVGKKTTVDYQVFVNGEIKKEHSTGKSAYDNFVNSVFGSAQLFALNVYQTQFPNDKNENGAPVSPEICIADNATLKGLYIKLLNGLDRSTAFNYADQNFKAEDKKKIDKENEITGYRNAIDDPEKIKEKILFLENSILDVEKQILQTNENIDGLENAKKVLQKQQQQSQTAESVIKLHNDRITKNQTAIKEQEGYKNYQGESSGEIQAKIDKLEAEKIVNDGIKKANDEKQEKYNTAIMAHTQNLIKYNKAKNEYNNEQHRIEKEISALKSNIKMYENSIRGWNEKIVILNKPCQKCGFIQGQEEIEKCKIQIIAENKTIDGYKAELAAKENALNALKKLVFALPAPTEPTKLIIKGYGDLQPIINNLNVQLKTVILMDTKSANADQIIRELNIDITATQELLTEEQKKIIPDIDKKIKENADLVTSNTSALKAVVEALNSQKAGVTSLKDQLAVIDTKKAQLIEYEKELQAIIEERETWIRHCKAWKRDGIPAMKLENAAPEVDMEVNLLLQKHYPKLQIDTSTLRPDATEKKDIEDFNIFVTNTITGDRYPIGGLSGEERNFFLRAFRKACRKISAREANREFMFELMDEPDGNVSEDLLPIFWQMESENIGDGEILKIAISHSPTAKEMFQQTIEIEKL